MPGRQDRLSHSTLSASCRTARLTPPRCPARSIGPSLSGRASLSSRLHSLALQEPAFQPQRRAADLRRRLRRRAWCKEQPQPRPVQAEAPQTPPAQPAFPEAQQERRNQWSLGDLLARASETKRHSMKRRLCLRIAASRPATSTKKRRRGAAVGEFGTDFTSDIASGIDERRVMDIWQRLKRGETEVLKQRGLYSRPAQQVVDRGCTGHYSTPLSTQSSTVISAISKRCCRIS